MNAINQIGRSNILKIDNRTAVCSSLFLICLFVVTTGTGTAAPHSHPMIPATKVTAEEATIQILANKTISKETLSKFKTISVKFEQDGKEVTYTGVPLRTLLSDSLPDLKLDSMPEWKDLARREVIMEVRGEDGYPGLVTALEVATNKYGDRFIIATEKDGAALDSAPQLICKMDTARTRWVHQVVSLRVLSIKP
jgi:hypothetical protein